MATPRYRGFVNDEEFRMQRLRNNWDPFDSFKKIAVDGEKARNGTRFNRSEERRAIYEQVEKGELQLNRATKNSNEVVYFVQATDGGPVKIGHTTHSAIKRRLSQLQRGQPVLLEVRALFDGGAWLERALHELFDDYRIRGEWFQVCPLMQKLCPEVV